MGHGDRGPGVVCRERSRRSRISERMVGFYRFSGDRPTEASTFWAIGHYLSNIGFFGSGYATAWTPPGIAVIAAVIAGLAVRGVARSRRADAAPDGSASPSSSCWRSC